MSATFIHIGEPVNLIKILKDYIRVNNEKLLLIATHANPKSLSKCCKAPIVTALFEIKTDGMGQSVEESLCSKCLKPPLLDKKGLLELIDKLKKTK